MPSRRIRLAVVLIPAVLVCARAAHAQATLVVQWNEVTLQAVRNTRFAPTLTARALAIVHTSMYDAWAAYDPAAIGSRYGGRLRRPPRERTDAAREMAVSYAAYRALVDLFPSQKAALFDPLMTTLGLDPADTSTDVKRAVGIGNRAAAAVLEFRHADGSNQLGDLNPGAYSDYTGYAPVNTPDLIQDPNRWQPLRAANGAVQTFLTPHWGLVKPFAIRTVESLRPEQPPLFPEKAYEREVAQILRLSGQLDDRRKVIASYWADGPSTETPPGHWSLFAQFVSQRDAHTLDDDVKMFFALGNALLDASIAVWDTKRFYDYIRPVSAIRYLYAGKQVPAWGGPFRGTETIPGEQFQSYLPTPPFAEYVSGHSTFSAASAEILRRFTSSDRLDALTIAAGSSGIEPGLVPAADVVLAWRTFSDAADQAGRSRRFGGIHFESGDLEARALGRRVGRRVWEKARALFVGHDRYVLQPSQGHDASDRRSR